MSADTDKTRAALQSILSFIEKEPSYVAITNRFDINLADTFTACQKTYSDAKILGQDLADLFATWNQIQPRAPDVLAEILIRSMVLKIETTSEELDRLKQDSSKLNVAANEVIGDLSTVSRRLHAQLETEQEETRRLESELNATSNEINHINHELSGSSGFWQGFLTGITAGIYSGLRDKLSKQKALRSQYNCQLQQLNQKSLQTQQDIQTINQIDPALSSVNSLDTSIVALENTMQSLMALAKQTEHDGEHIIGQENGKVAEFYHKRFENDMNALLEWQNVFPT
ncbi:MAG: hypothetical protein MJE63_06925 [Proteobacteria bacterium]|nr:hypothetical protein [Pseudomonadota bacterium]